jgi:hypothetical protein
VLVLLALYFALFGGGGGPAPILKEAVNVTPIVALQHARGEQAAKALKRAEKQAAEANGVAEKFRADLEKLLGNYQSTSADFTELMNRLDKKQTPAAEAMVRRMMEARGYLTNDEWDEVMKRARAAQITGGVN